MTLREWEAFSEEWEETRKRVLKGLKEEKKEYLLCAYDDKGNKLGGLPEAFIKAERGSK